MSFTALKMVGVVFFIASLAVLFALLRNYLPYRYGLLLVAVIGFNPFFWDFKDDILSDIPFFFFALLTAFLIERKSSPLLCGFVAYLAIGTRVVGVVLLAAILLHEIFGSKRVTKRAATIILTAVLLLLAQRLALSGEVATGYKEIIRPALATSLANLWDYPASLLSFWHRRPGPLAILIPVMALLLAIRGAIGRTPLFLGLFTCLYGATLIVFPWNPDRRYLIPLFPLFVFYAVRGMERLGRTATVLAPPFLLAGYV